MMKFARKVARDAAAVAAGDVAALKRCGFSDTEVFHIVATVSARAFVTKLLDGLGTEADAAYLAPDEPLGRSRRSGSGNTQAKKGRSGPSKERYPAGI